MASPHFNIRSAYVAFLDILGFKEMVKAKELAELAKVYENLVVPNVQMAASRGAFADLDGPDGKIRVADLSKSRIAVLIVSDSIIL